MYNLKNKGEKIMKFDISNEVAKIIGAGASIFMGVYTIVRSCVNIKAMKAGDSK